MPIWAPVGGRPGVAISGQSTGAWSEVIRHADTGGVGEAAQPRPGVRGPRRPARRNSRASLEGAGSLGTAGRSWPKSASSRVTSRPVRGPRVTATTPAARPRRRPDRGRRGGG